ncbi:MAG: (d)CMP kinase [Longimicrobiales bacterium]
MIIAIDGPAGSGKSTTAEAVADALGFRHLDSGALYRALTAAAVQHGVPESAWPSLSEADLDRLGVSATVEPTGLRVRIDGRDAAVAIRAPEVNARVSHLAAQPTVRHWVNQRLREASRHLDVVADGRDIGTVVFPDAELKVFLTAAPAIRARRRLADHGNTTPRDDEVRAETERLLTRDRLDRERSVAPLRRAPDAVDVDTSNIGFDEQVARIVELARQRGA